MAIKKIDNFLEKQIMKVTFYLKGCSKVDVILFV